MNNLKKQILSVAVATSTVLSCVPVSMAAIPADVQGTRCLLYTSPLYAVRNQLKLSQYMMVRQVWQAFRTLLRDYLVFSDHVRKVMSA